jgi:hypothetical protein
MHETVRPRDLSVLAVTCFLLRLPALISTRWFDPDEAAIAVQAQTIARGGRLYVDIADRKPPVPPLVQAAWIDLTGSPDPRGPRLVVTALLALAAVVLCVEVARTHGRTVALWAAALYVVGCYGLVAPDAAAANYAHFALPFATLALVACRREGWYPLAGGVLLGFAVLSRQSWVFAVPAGAVSCLAAARVRGAALYCIGLAAAVATAGLMAPWSDYWFWNFESSPGFVFATIDPLPALAAGLASVGLFTLLHLALVAAALGEARPQRLREAWRRQGDLWLWVVTGLAAWAAGFRFFGHYWLQVVPPLVLLAAPVVTGWSRPWRRATMASLAGTVLFAVGGQFDPGLFHPRPTPDRLAQVVRACTEEDDPVFVWGSFPELLVAVDRPVAGGLVHSDFVTGRSGGRSDADGAATPGARERMMADLLAAAPAVLIDTSKVDDLGYGAFPMLADADLAEFVQAGGYLAADVDDYRLWVAPWRPCKAVTE